MSINLTGVAEGVETTYSEEVQILADEVEDLISWGLNTEQEIEAYLGSEETWNSENQAENVQDALSYLEEEDRVTKSFKKYDGFDIGYTLKE